MASTTVQCEVEDWVRDVWMAGRYGVPFSRRRLRLVPGGEFQFGAVSEDGGVVGIISTSSCRTASGKLGVGKMMKIRSDLYFLSLLPPRGGAEKVVVLTDRGMWEVWEKEKRAGRVGAGVEFLHVGEVPRELAERLAGAQRVAAEEVTPRGGEGEVETQELDVQQP